MGQAVTTGRVSHILMGTIILNLVMWKREGTSIYYQLLSWVLALKPLKFALEKSREAVEPGNAIFVLHDQIVYC